MPLALARTFRHVYNTFESGISPRRRDEPTTYLRARPGWLAAVPPPILGPREVGPVGLPETTFHPNSNKVGHICEQSRLSNGPSSKIFRNVNTCWPSTPCRPLLWLAELSAAAVSRDILTNGLVQYASLSQRCYIPLISGDYIRADCWYG